MGGDSNPKLIFTYGTLKRGLPNHPLLERVISTRDALFLGPFTTRGHFPLVIGPNGVPFLLHLPGSGQPVHGELYQVTSRGLGPLDQLEGITDGHYERRPLEVVGDDGEVVAAEAYFAHKSFGTELWKRCGEEGIGEYTLEMSRNYVRRSDREEAYGFVQDVWKFINCKD